LQRRNDTLQKTMQTLNLTGTPCPINFVRTKLKLERMELGEVLEVALDDGEAIESVNKSITEEGQKVLEKTQQEDSSWKLVIEKKI